MGVACVYRASQVNSTSLEKAPQLHNVRHPRVLLLAPFFGSRLETLCSLHNACYSHRAQYSWFPPTGVRGTRPVSQRICSGSRICSGGTFTLADLFRFLTNSADLFRVSCFDRKLSLATAVWSEIASKLSSYVQLAMCMFCCENSGSKDYALSSYIAIAS